MSTRAALVGTAALLALLLAAACSDPEPEPEASSAPGEPAVTPETVTPATTPPAVEAPVLEQRLLAEYHCEDGTPFNATFGNQEVLLDIQGNRYELRQQPAEMGSLYSDDQWQLLVRDGDALLTSTAGSRNCQVLVSRQTLVDPSLPPAPAAGSAETP